MIRCDECVGEIVPATVQIAWRRSLEGSTWIVSSPLCDKHASGYRGQTCGAESRDLPLDP